MVGVALGLDAGVDLRPHRRMHDGIEGLELLVVAEDPIGDLLAVEGAVGLEDLRAEVLDHGGEHRTARRLELADHGVGVDHHRPTTGERRRHGGFPGADTAREADEEHGREASTGSPARSPCGFYHWSVQGSATGADN